MGERGGLVRSVGRALPAVLLPPAVVERREGHGARATPSTVRLTGDVMAELSRIGGAQVLHAPVVLELTLESEPGLEALDDFFQRKRLHALHLLFAFALIAQFGYKRTENNSIFFGFCQGRRLDILNNSAIINMFSG